MNTPRRTPGINSNRCLWVDAAKGAGILLVLIGHSKFFNFCTEHSESVFISVVQYIVKLAMASFMPLFYVLSGYTFKERPGILKQRFFRLMRPYVLWGFFSLIFTWGIIFVKDFSLTNLIRPTVGILYARFSLYTPGNESCIRLLPYGAAPLWFLASLFTSYVSFMALIRFHQYKKELIFLYIIATILLSRLSFLMPWSLDTAPAGALFIYAGYKMQTTKLFFIRKKPLLILLIIMLLLYIPICNLNGKINMSIREYGQWPYLSPVFFIFIGIIGSIIYSISCIFLEKFKLTAALAYLGRISIILLCCHSFAFYSMRALFSPLSPFHTSIFSPTQYLFAAELTSSIILALIISKVTKGKHKKFRQTTNT